MKIQLMVEVEGEIPNSKNVEQVQESEHRWLRLYGLEDYLKSLIKSQVENGGTVNFSLRVVPSDKERLK